MRVADARPFRAEFGAEGEQGHEIGRERLRAAGGIGADDARQRDLAQRLAQIGEDVALADAVAEHGDMPVLAVGNMRIVIARAELSGTLVDLHCL